jgi:hypothetical protein
MGTLTFLPARSSQVARKLDDLVEEQIQVLLQWNSEEEPFPEGKAFAKYVLEIFEDILPSGFEDLEEILGDLFQAAIFLRALEVWGSSLSAQGRMMDLFERRDARFTEVLRDLRGVT